VWPRPEARDHDGPEKSASANAAAGRVAGPKIHLRLDLIFLNENHEVRSGWKFAIYIVFFLIIWVATGIALSIVIGRSEGITENQLALLALNEIALFVPAVLAMLLTMDRQSGARSTSGNVFAPACGRTE
jgi:hypothetical protein